MPKVLFLGCNTDQIPYLRAAKALGFEVIGTDMNSDAPGATLADRFFNVSYTDVEGLIRAAEAGGCGQGDRIFTAAAHFAYEGAAHVASSLQIPFASPEAVDVCLDKTKFYALLGELEVKVPPARVFVPDNSIVPESGKTYYLKSDYGKSPRYCYRIVDGKVPPLPVTFDAFYRRHFLLQEEVEGTHYRVNVHSGQASVFLKLGDAASVPIPVLGPDHDGVIGKLSEVASALGLESYLTKFDLIFNEEGWYVIDIGLDSPLRLGLLCEYLGRDFPAAYTRYYLLGDAAAMPAWGDICRSVLIQGTPEEGYTVEDWGKPHGKARL